jgi:hypothetical protein
MIILLKENYSKLLILYFFLLREFCDVLLTKTDTDHRKSVVVTHSEFHLYRCI